MRPEGSRSTPRPRARALGAVPLVVLVAATTMALATVVRAPCVAGLLDDPSAPRFCGTQIPDLLFVEDLTEGRLPFLERCVPPPGEPCDEYPVITMYAMWVGGALGADPLTYYLVNAAILSICALAVAWMLVRAAGPRALYFAAAPTLLLFGLMNWDLAGLVLAVWAMTAFLEGRDTQAGIGIGLAVATKLFPALFLVGMVADRWIAGAPRRAARIVVAAGAAWLVVNLPFAVLAPGPWSRFFRFNSSRPPDVDSLWFIACRRGFGEASCVPTTLVNVASLLVFLVGAGIVWRGVARRDPGFARWTLGLPLLVLFFLANKVYSPQYDVWLLPWFALALPNPWLFAAFSLAEIPLFLTRYADLTAPPSVAFHVTVLARDAVLLLCVLGYVRGWASTGGVARARAGEGVA